MMNKWGRIVSLVKHRTAKKEKRLEKAGYFAKKGKFGYVKKTVGKRGKTARKSRKSRKMRGGGDGDAEPAVDADKPKSDTAAEVDPVVKVEVDPEPAVKSDEPAEVKAGEPATKSDEPATKSDEPAVKSD
jgi:hypothetical protein